VLAASSASTELIESTMSISMPATATATCHCRTGQIGPLTWLLAELTYRCLRCTAFCYNPVDFARQEEELSTEGPRFRHRRKSRARLAQMGAVQLGRPAASRWCAMT
jgi:pyrroloquinoline quinone biosynthesis protein E